MKPVILRFTLPVVGGKTRETVAQQEFDVTLVREQVSVSRVHCAAILCEPE